MKRAILRALSHVRLFDLDWFDEMVDIAAAARQQRLEDEARDTRDKRDMARWLREPDARRPRPRRQP